MYAVFAVLSAIMSLLIIVGELGILLFPESNSSSFVEKLFKKDLGGFLVTNILILIPLGYLCFCTYYGLFHFKVWGLYELHSNKLTDPFSLVFSGT